MKNDVRRLLRLLAFAQAHKSCVDAYDREDGGMGFVAWCFDCDERVEAHDLSQSVSLELFELFKSHIPTGDAETAVEQLATRLRTTQAVH
jgi:hypothetical protein